MSAAFFAAHQSVADSDHPISSSTNSAEGIRSPQLLDFVGGVRRNLSERELDLHIRDLGRLSEKAMRDHDPTGARIWSDRMYEAIRSRTPEHQARLEREAMERADEGTFAGEWTREVLGRRIG